MKKKQFLIIGLGRFGSALAEELVRLDMEVMAIDRYMENVEAHRSVLTDVIQGDAMDKRVLNQIGAQNFDTVVVAAGEDIRSSGIITMHLKEMGAKNIIVKASDDFYGRMLLKLGADKIIYPERDMGQRIAHNLVSEKILDFIELSPDYSLMEMRPQQEWVGKMLKELNLRIRENINIVAIRTGRELNAMPMPDTVLSENDVLLVVAMTQM